MTYFKLFKIVGIHSMWSEWVSVSIFNIVGKLSIPRLSIYLTTSPEYSFSPESYEHHAVASHTYKAESLTDIEICRDTVVKLGAFLRLPWKLLPIQAHHSMKGKRSACQGYYYHNKNQGYKLTVMFKSFIDFDIERSFLFLRDVTFPPFSNYFCAVCLVFRIGRIGGIG